MNTVNVVDLDGTLISVNSFPKWVLHLLSLKIRRFRLFSSARIVLWLGLRKARLLSHTEFKRRISGIPVNHPDVLAFASSLTRFANENVLHRVQLPNGEPVVIATAAPSVYVGALVRSLGIEAVSILASDYREGTQEYVDNRGEIKRDRVLEKLKQDFPEAEKIKFYTDHRDDASLAAASDHTIICYADSKSKETLQRSAKSSELLDSQWTIRRRNSRTGYACVDLSNPVHLQEATALLVAMHLERSTRPDLIVSIATGGVEVGAAFEEALNTPHVVVRCQRPSTPKKDASPLRRILKLLPNNVNWWLRGLEAQRAEKKFEQAKGLGKPVSSKRVVELASDQPSIQDAAQDPSLILVVDDTVDSGATAKAVIEYIRELFPDAAVEFSCLGSTFREPLVSPQTVLLERSLVRGPWSLDARANVASK